MHVTGAGNEVIVVWGDAPDADYVELCLAGECRVVPVNNGSFHLTIPALPAGIYTVSGTWTDERSERVAGELLVSTTTGHLAAAALTVVGTEVTPEPSGVITILEGAHLDGCDPCILVEAGVVQAGGHVAVTNSDSERHQFNVQTHGTASPTGNLDPGETVRLPFNEDSTSRYHCIYHPWLTFEVVSTGSWNPPEESGSLTIDAPRVAGQSVKVDLTYTGDAPMAHAVFIQDGSILGAETIQLAGGYGTFFMDARGWAVGEVIVSVQAGDEHAATTITVMPAAVTVQRTGVVTGYSGLDGILIDGVVSRPSAVIPLDASMDATRQVCAIGESAVFNGDAGLSGRNVHYSVGTVLCGGTNLGVFLLESGLALPDPDECSKTDAHWVLPYCYPGGDMQESSITETGVPGGTPLTEEPVDDGPGGETPPIIVEELKPGEPGSFVPETGGPEFNRTEGNVLVDPLEDAIADITDEIPCDPVIDPGCPCPSGWVRTGEYCDPVWDDAVDMVGEIAGDIAEDTGIPDAASSWWGQIQSFMGGLIEWMFGLVGLGI